MKTPKYAQIVNCGKFKFALWDYPQTHKFYPIHGSEEECVDWLLENGYELAAMTEKRSVWKLTKSKNA